MRLALTLFSILLFSTFAYANDHSVLYEINGIQYEGYFQKAEDNAPFVLLLHDWDGLTDYETQRAKMLVNLGYTVFAADLFGAGVRPTEVKDKKQHTGELYKDRKKLRSLMSGALKFAQSKGADTKNAVAMGYCFGGAAVLELARSGADLKGFVTFHGGLGLPDDQDYTAAKGEFLILHGTADTNITMDQFGELALDLETEGISHEMITYSGAPHGFTVFGSKRYRKDADRKSWQRFGQFLEEVFKHSPE